MSTENVEVFNRYYGNGVATQFSVGFPYLKREFVKVYLYKKDTDEEKMLNSDQFSFVNDATIQYPVLPTDEILEEGDILTIQRETELGSEFEFDNQRRLFPVEVMNADDLAFQQIQELSREIKRAIRVNPTATESPEELLQTVYDKLDSATEVAEDAIIAANQAQVAADNATAAVESVEQTLVETQAYVDSAKIEINNTKETAIEEVDIKVTDAKADINSTVVTAQADITSVKDTAIDAVEAAVADLGQTVIQAKADIDNTKTTAETSITNTVNQGKADIQGYIDDAEDEVRQIARDEAQSAIADAKQDVQAYADTTIKPSLQAYVDSASASEQVATASADTAVEKATQASASATSAQSSAVTAEDWAKKLGGTVDGTEYSAKKYAQDAAEEAVLAQYWATKTDGTVDGSEYSAKYYANQAHPYTAGTGIDITGNVISCTASGDVGDVKVNGVSVVTNKVAEVTVPTKTSDLTNDSNFVNTTQLAAKQNVSNLSQTLDDSTTKYPSNAAIAGAGFQTASDVATSINAINALAKIPNYTLTFASSISLTTNTSYVLTLGGDITFALPSPEAGKLNQIEVQIYMATAYTIDLGTTYYFGGSAPDMSEAGYYSIMYEYDWLQQQWVAGALKKGAES